nr:MAG TPA: hypothetical protein [Caudoviricetes sp.]
MPSSSFTASFRSYRRYQKGTLFRSIVFIGSFLTNDTGKRNDFTKQRRRHISVLIRTGNAVFTVSGFSLSSTLVYQISGNLHLIVGITVGNRTDSPIEGIGPAKNLIPCDRQIGGKHSVISFAGHCFQHGQLFRVSHTFHLSFLCKMNLTASDFLSGNGSAFIVGNEHTPAVLGSGKALSDAGELTVIPLGAMVKADLAEELIFLTGTGLSQRLQEEVALAGNRLVNRGQHIQVQQQGRTSGKTLAQVQIHNADGSHHTGQRNAVNLTGSGNHGKAVLNGVSVDLEQRGSVTPQAQAIGGSVGTVNLFHHVGNVPQTKGLAAHGLDIGGDSGDKTTGLVHSGVTGGLVVDAVDEGVLNITVHLLHLSGYLEVQLIDGVLLLVGHIQAAQGAHVGLLGIGNAHGLLENLSHIGLLLTGHHSSVRGGQRSSFGNRGLRAGAAARVLLTGHELDMVGGLSPAADDRTQRTPGIALVEEHTGVVQHTEAGSKNIRHDNSPLLVLRLGLFLGFQASVVSDSSEIAVLLRFLDFLVVINGSTAAAGTTGRLRSLLDSVCLDFLRIIFEELALIGKYLGTIAIGQSLSGVLGQSFIIALSDKLGLVLGNGLTLAKLFQLLFHLGQLVSVLLLLLFLFGEKSIMLTLPLSGFGIGLGECVLLPFQLGSVILILKRFQSFQLVFCGHIRIPFDLTGVNLCHNKFLLRLTRLFTQHRFLFLSGFSPRCVLRSSLTISSLSA